MPKIPTEIFMRFDDVAYDIPEQYSRCNAEQKDRIIEEVEHLSEMLRDPSNNWYADDTPAELRKKRNQCRAFLKAVTPKGGK